jgi:hypothetical protein
MTPDKRQIVSESELSQIRGAAEAVVDRGGVIACSLEWAETVLDLVAALRQRDELIAAVRETQQLPQRLIAALVAYDARG